MFVERVSKCAWNPQPREPGLIVNEPAFIRADLQSNAVDQN
ncbi:hypothetical protein C4K04_2561 [Pseudomonas chlororaphis]|uniref:Uncharacterized protein n=1 Tax=Pseudomonas chlororaphis TaxID=587753 RepID=A0A3G7TM98_9PSED|nr:hypothetical protein C4K04_2561 [Pseudomonas chlororaphis]